MALGRVHYEVTSERGPSILIIDADAERCGRLCADLSARGLSAEAVHDGRLGLARAVGRGYDLILLSGTLPGGAGLELLRVIRRRSSVPVVMLMPRCAGFNGVSALDAGADDTCPDPFEPDELAARLRALLRRAYRPPRSAPADCEASGVRLEPGTRAVFCDGRPVGTTTIEFQILELLLRSAGHPVSRGEMIAVLHRRPATPFDRSVDVHVSHLRRKLGARGALIRTVRGVGYLFQSDGRSTAHTDPR